MDLLQTLKPSEPFYGNKLMAYLHAFLKLETGITPGVRKDLQDLIDEDPEWLNIQYSCNLGEYVEYEDFYCATDVIMHRLCDDDLLEYASQKGGLTSDELRYVNDISDKIIFVKNLLTSYEFLRSACQSEFKAIGVKLTLPPYKQETDLFYKNNRDNGFKSDLHFITWAQANSESLVAAVPFQELAKAFERERNFRHFCTELRELGIIAQKTTPEQTTQSQLGL